MASLFILNRCQNHSDSAEERNPAAAGRRDIPTNFGRISGRTVGRCKCGLPRVFSKWSFGRTSPKIGRSIGSLGSRVSPKNPVGQPAIFSISERPPSPEVLGTGNGGFRRFLRCRTGTVRRGAAPPVVRRLASGVTEPKAKA